MRAREEMGRWGDGLQLTMEKGKYLEGPVDLARVGSPDLQGLMVWQPSQSDATEGLMDGATGGSSSGDACGSGEAVDLATRLTAGNLVATVVLMGAVVLMYLEKAMKVPKQREGLASAEDLATKSPPQIT